MSTTTPVYTIGALKTFNGMEGQGYNCTLLRDAKKVAECIDVLWTDVLEEEVLDCPVASAVGGDSSELIAAAQALLNMMADISDDEREAIRRAAARQCEVFYFG